MGLRTLDPFEDRVGELSSRCPGPAVEQLDLHRPEERLHQAVVVGAGSRREPRLGQPLLPGDRHRDSFD